MYKVLLADDELLDLEGLHRFIPWHDLGMQVERAVTSGFAAIDALNEVEIDILVTDIRMPNMSGLELARKALLCRENLRIIFISGHQDFDYVKQALSLNAVSYVLKPMDDQEMIGSLMKIKQELDLEKKRKQAEIAFHQMKSVVKNEYLLQLLEGSIEQHVQSVLRDEDGNENIQLPVRVAVLELDDLAWKLNPYSEKQKQELLADFIQTVVELCDQHQIRYFCKMSKNRLALLLEQRHEYGKVLSAFIQHTAVHFPFSITIGVGSVCESMSMLPDSYQKAIQAVGYKMFEGKGRWIDYVHIQPTKLEDMRNLEDRLGDLFNAMSDYELVRIYDELERLFKLASTLRSRFTVHNFATYIMLKLDQYLHTLGEDLFKLLDIELNNLEILLQFETINDIRSWMNRQIFVISERLHERKQKKNWKLIRDINEYVREHLHETITLRDVANRFSFSPNYLGSIFKEGTNKNFSEYLNEMRMERACELLGDPSLKIYEVASQVGYRYLPYFNKQFKETFARTPNEYRRLISI
ncbi:response regulator [Paenibacillus sp. N1-5-1-14]|nr:response regulator [Paenibacillus radicibacter]